MASYLKPVQTPQRPQDIAPSTSLATQIALISLLFSVAVGVPGICFQWKQDQREERRDSQEVAQPTLKPTNVVADLKSKALANSCTIPTKIVPRQPGAPTEVVINNEYAQYLYIDKITLTGEWVKTSAEPRQSVTVGKHDIVFRDFHYHGENKHYCGSFDPPIEIAAFGDRRLRIAMQLPTKSIYSLKGQIKLHLTNGDTISYENFVIDVVEPASQVQVANAGLPGGRP